MLWGPIAPGTASGDRSGSRATARYTRAMRRWFCVFVLLAGFSGDRYAWGIRAPVPVAIERRIDLRPTPSGTRMTRDWWRRS